MKRIGVLIVILVSGLANAAINGGSYLVDMLQGRDPILTPVVSSSPAPNVTPVSASQPFGQVVLSNPLLSGLGFGGGTASGGMVTGGPSSNELPFANQNPLAGGGSGSGDGSINIASTGEGGSFALVTFFASNANYGGVTGTVNFSNGSLFFTPATGVSFAGNFPGGNATTNNGSTVAVVLIPTVPEPMTWLMLCIGFGYLALIKRTRNLQL